MVSLATGACLVLAASPWVNLTWDSLLVQQFDRDTGRAGVERALDDAVDFATTHLNVRLSKAVRAHVYTKTAYRTKFGVLRATHVAAHYRSGMIHINGARALDEAFTGIAVHEMVHALLDHRGRGRRFPTWMNEGLAEHARHTWLAARGADPQDRASTRAALRGAPLLPLPQRGGAQPQHYLTSWLAVETLRDAIGAAALNRLVGRVIEREDFERTFRETTGRDPQRFAREVIAGLGGGRAPKSARPTFR